MTRNVRTWVLRLLQMISSLIMIRATEMPPPSSLVIFGEDFSDNGVDASKDLCGFQRNSNGPIWVDYLADRLFDKKPDVKNFAYSGAKSGWNGKEKLGNWSGILWQIERSYYCGFVKEFEEDDLVILQTAGVNDILAGAKPEMVNDNFKKALDMLAEKGAKQLMVLNIIDPSGSPGWGRSKWRRQTPIYQKKVAEVNSFLSAALTEGQIRIPGDLSVSLVDWNTLFLDLKSQYRNPIKPYIDLSLGDLTENHVWEHVWYDEWFPTTAVHKNIGDYIYETWLRNEKERRAITKQILEKETEPGTATNPHTTIAQNMEEIETSQATGSPQEKDAHSPILGTTRPSDSTTQQISTTPKTAKLPTRHLKRRPAGAVQFKIQDSIENLEDKFFNAAEIIKDTDFTDVAGSDEEDYYYYEKKTTTDRVPVEDLDEPSTAEKELTKVSNAVISSLFAEAGEQPPAFAIDWATADPPKEGEVWEADIEPDEEESQVDVGAYEDATDSINKAKLSPFENKDQLKTGSETSFKNAEVLRTISTSSQTSNTEIKEISVAPKEEAGPEIEDSLVPRLNPRIFGTEPIISEVTTTEAGSTISTTRLDTSSTTESQNSVLDGSTKESAAPTVETSTVSESYSTQESSSDSADAVVISSTLPSIGPANNLDGPESLANENSTEKHKVEFKIPSTMPENMSQLVRKLKGRIPIKLLMKMKPAIEVGKTRTPIPGMDELASVTQPEHQFPTIGSGDDILDIPIETSQRPDLDSLATAENTTDVSIQLDNTTTNSSGPTESLDQVDSAKVARHPTRPLIIMRRNKNVIDGPSQHIQIDERIAKRIQDGSIDHFVKNSELSIDGEVVKDDLVEAVTDSPLSPDNSSVDVSHNFTSEFDTNSTTRNLTTEIDDNLSISDVSLLPGNLTVDSNPANSTVKAEEPGSTLENGINLLLSFFKPLIKSGESQ